MKKKICMFLNSPVAGDQRVFKEARTLADAGYDLTILCNQKVDLPVSSVWDGIKIISIPRIPSPLFPLRFTFQWIRQAVALKPDLIHAHDLNTLGRAFITAKLSGAILVYDSHDWCTEIPALPNFIALRRFYYRWKERFLARRAAEVIFPVPGLCRIAVEKLGVAEPVCICNFPRGGEISPNNLLRTELGLGENTRIVIYEGVLTENRSLEEIALSARLLPQDIAIVFLGEGSLKKHLQDLVLSNKLEDKVKFVENVSVETFPLYCAGADVGIVIYKVGGLTTIHGWPTKVFDYLRAGMPVLISAGPEITRMVMDDGAGKEILEKTPEGIARAIMDILSDDFEFRQSRRRARDSWRERYNWESEAKKLLALYDGLFHPRKSGS